MLTLVQTKRLGADELMHETVVPFELNHKDAAKYVANKFGLDKHCSMVKSKFDMPKSRFLQGRYVYEVLEIESYTNHITE